MHKRKLINKVITENYDSILHYCIIRLDYDLFAAEDCTQDVFLLLVKKSNELDLTHNIRSWLFSSAERIVKNYLKQKAKHDIIVVCDLESIKDLPSPIQPSSSKFDVLTEDEYNLLKKYYLTDCEDRNQIANEIGITVNALYKRIHDIKRKLQNAERRSDEIKKQ